jgi:PAS domain S-box-containing protein
MRTTTKIYLVHLILFLAFIAFIVVWGVNKRNAQTLLHKSMEEHDYRLFTRVNELMQQRTKTPLLDNSTWDETIRYIKKPSKHFVEECLSSLLPTFNINHIWVYNVNGEQCFYVNDSNSVDIPVIITPAELKHLLTVNTPFCHFFHKSEGKLVEIFGATVTSSFDINHKETPQGYMLFGKTWDSAYVNEHHEISGSDISVLLDPDHLPTIVESEYTVMYHPLHDYTGALIGRFQIVNKINMQAQWDREVNFSLLMNIFVWATGIILIGLLLHTMVSRPLSAIMQSLDTSNEAPLIQLQEKTNEFGKIASMLIDTFRLKKELQTSEENFRAIFENNATAIAIYDTELSVSMANEACCRLVGTTEKELLGLAWVKLIPLAVLENIKKYHEQKVISSEGKPPEKLEFSFFRKDGELRNGLLSVSFLDTKGKLVASITDITERKRAEAILKENEAHLRELNTTKDKFFSIIAHDLRSPFNVYLNMTRVIQDNFSSMTKEEILEFNKAMEVSASNLYRLLENLLEWAQMQRGMFVFNPGNALLYSSTKSTLELLKQSTIEKKVELHIDIPGDLIVYTDMQMLESVLRNLTNNAVKFTPSGGVITISASLVSSDLVKISIQDTGIGMSMALVDHLFRLDINTSRRGTAGEPGTGLGLILAKEFIEKNGGTLTVESEEGKGSIFSFTVPHKSDIHWRV